MNIVYRKVDEIIPYEKNPRINDAAVEAVANSIKEFVEVTEKTANFLSASKRSQILQNGSLLQFNGKVL